jgi:hypothetical protein
VSARRCSQHLREHGPAMPSAIRRLRRRCMQQSRPVWEDVQHNTPRPGQCRYQCPWYRHQQEVFDAAAAVTNSGSQGQSACSQEMTLVQFTDRAERACDRVRNTGTTCICEAVRLVAVVGVSICSAGTLTSCRPLSSPGRAGVQATDAFRPFCRSSWARLQAKQRASS